MTRPWSPRRDATALHAEAADDALGEIYAGRDSWPDDETPTRADLARDEAGYE